MTINQSSTIKYHIPLVVTIITYLHRQTQPHRSCPTKHSLAQSSSVRRKARTAALRGGGVDADPSGGVENPYGNGGL